MNETLFDLGGDPNSGMESMPSISSVDPVPLTERESLVSDPVVSTPVPTFRHFGGNKRRYLFLTNEDRHEWMSTAALDAFVKTLAALKLTTEDVSVLNVAGMEPFPGRAAILSHFKPEVLISLGVSLPWAGLEGLPPGTVTEHQGLRVFCTQAFDIFLLDADKKRVFWNTIKNLLA